MTVTEIHPDGDQDGRQGAGFVTVLVLFIAVQLSGAYIMMGIMQEKGATIVEPLPPGMAGGVVAHVVIASGVRAGRSPCPPGYAGPR